MLGYYFQGVIDETETLQSFAGALNAACKADMEMANKGKRMPHMHCTEAKLFEPQAQIILPTSDAMLAFISSGLLTHPALCHHFSQGPSKPKLLVP